MATTTAVVQAISHDVLGLRLIAAHGVAGILKMYSNRAAKGEVKTLDHSREIYEGDMAIKCLDAVLYKRRASDHGLAHGSSSK